jgi:serine protease inhibitor
LIWPFKRHSHPQDAFGTVTEAEPFPPDRFAFKLFRELVRANDSSNVFCSPFSVMLCLMMIWEGATGETREAMAKVLEIAEDPGACQRFLNEALAISSPGLELAIANSLWSDEQVRMLPAFLTMAREKYAPEVVSLPFQSPATVPRINAWVVDKTRGKIGTIIDSLGPSELLVALNAIYFKGLWRAPFEKSLTREERFFTPGDHAVKVPLMLRFGYFRYHAEFNFQAVRLPYQGNRVGMYIFLPSRESDLPAFLRALTWLQWGRWIGTLSETEGVLGLPRFKFEHYVELAPILAHLGMSEAFDPERAQFDGVALPPPPIYIGQVIHRSVVEVNEEGTEAAAITEMAMPLASLRPTESRRFRMIVDRPFFFVIRDDDSNMILFMGAVNDPT